MSNFRKFLNENNLYRTEGETGLSNLEKVLGEIGYKETGFHHGTPVEEFLKDNPGAIDTLYDFIEEYFTEEFEQEEVVDLDSLDEDIRKCYEFALENGKDNVVEFIKYAIEEKYELFYYRGRNFYFGPAVKVPALSCCIEDAVECNTDSLGKQFVVYPKQGLGKDLE